MRRIIILLSLMAFAFSSHAQEPPFMSNVYGRDHLLLNGKWNAIVDLYDQGVRMEVFKNRKPQKNEEFYEYSFEGGLRLNVPGDWNSQYPELKYY
jgi:beta-glucuronidase